MLASRAMRRFLPPLLLLLVAACAPPPAARHDRAEPVRTVVVYVTPTPMPQASGSTYLAPTANGEFYVRDGQEIWMKPDAVGAKPRRVLKTDAHEGLGALAISPDRHWLTTIVSYPYDQPSESLQTYPILVYVDGGTRIDKEQFAGLFGVSGTPASYSWVAGRVATLEVTMLDGTKTRLDLPPSGPAPLPPPQ